MKVPWIVLVVKPNVAECWSRARRSFRLLRRVAQSFSIFLEREKQPDACTLCFPIAVQHICRLPQLPGPGFWLASARTGKEPPTNLLFHHRKPHVNHSLTQKEGAICFSIDRRSTLNRGWLLVDACLTREQSSAIVQADSRPESTDWSTCTTAPWRMPEGERAGSQAAYGMV